MVIGEFFEFARIARETADRRHPRTHVHTHKMTRISILSFRSFAIQNGDAAAIKTAGVGDRLQNGGALISPVSPSSTTRAALYSSLLYVRYLVTLLTLLEDYITIRIDGFKQNIHNNFQIRNLNLKKLKALIARVPETQNWSRRQLNQAK